MNTTPSRFLLRGVVEGFYGRPWTHGERIDIFRFMKRWDLNCYIYAPKDDPLHRHKWQDAYSDEQLARFRELIHHASDNDVQFCYAVSPGLSISYSDPSHFECLLQKCHVFMEMGVLWYGLFFDDIPLEMVHERDVAAFSSLAEGQAYLANRLLAALRDKGDANLIFCPTVYQGSPDSPYLRDLRTHIDSEIFVMWTGTGVVSREIREEEAMAIRKAIGRRIVYWDNYPVNDSLMNPELHIGPYTGRSPNLSSYVDGLFANPMSFPEASKVGLASVAQYLANPTTYNSTEAWYRSLDDLVDPAVAAPFRRFAAANTYSALDRSDPPLLRAALEEYWDGLNRMKFSEAPRRLREFFVQMTVDAAALKEGLPHKLICEIAPWLEEYNRWGEIGIYAVDTIISLLSFFHGSGENRDVDKEFRKNREMVEAGLIEAVGFRTKVCGETIREFAQDVYRSTSIYAGVISGT